MDSSTFFAADWLNTGHPMSLEDFRGRVLAVEVFQMLCPGCVLTGLPQAQRLAQSFEEKDLVVIGLHSVFEHHDGNSRESLAAFLHEWRIGFPVAIDAPATARCHARWRLGTCRARPASCCSTGRARCVRATSGRYPISRSGRR